MTLPVIIAIIVAAVAILVLLSLTSKTNARGIDRTHFANEWNDILAESKDSKTRPMSIVHADKLLDEALRCLGCDGTTFAERLVCVKSKLTQKDTVWSAHKLRNKIVHETQFDPTPADVNRALKGYQRAFKDLGVL